METVVDVHVCVHTLGNYDVVRNNSTQEIRKFLHLR